MVATLVWIVECHGLVNLSILCGDVDELIIFLVMSSVIYSLGILLLLCQQEHSTIDA